MRKIMPRWFAVMAAISLTVVSYGTWQSLNEKTNAPEMASEIAENEIQTVNLQDYFWLDAIPEDAYTPFNAYMFTKGMGINSQFASSFKVTLEMFDYRADNSKIKFNFLHDNRAANSEYTITAYKNSKYPFLDSQLTVKSDPQFKGKEKVYYSGPDLHLQAQQNNLPENLQTALTSARAQLATMNR